jgi:hypothetical protein
MNEILNHYNISNDIYFFQDNIFRVLSVLELDWNSRLICWKCLLTNEVEMIDELMDDHEDVCSRNL